MAASVLRHAIRCPQCALPARTVRLAAYPAQAPPPAVTYCTVASTPAPRPHQPVGALPGLSSSVIFQGTCTPPPHHSTRAPSLVPTSMHVHAHSSSSQRGGSASLHWVFGLAAAAAGALVASSLLQERTALAQEEETKKDAAQVSEDVLQAREIDFLASANDVDENGNVIARRRMVRIIREVQDMICAEIERVDGGTFHEDRWHRKLGGGGVSRVLQDGKVVEKAGVHVSVVFGAGLPAAALKQMTSKHNSLQEYITSGKDPTKLPFFACGVSLIIHPRNPFAPTAHANFRYFELGGQDGDEPVTWWFGGGADLTPHYAFKEDAVSWHSVWKHACDQSDEAFYPRFKKWCDDYFYIKHRQEHRGIGGIFYDDLSPETCSLNQEQLLAFAERCGKSFNDAYIPILEARQHTPYSSDNRRWQELRHGRYAEFNLVYDRGTKFGLSVPGSRIESVLSSIPLTCRWEYQHEPPAGSHEAYTLNILKNPVDWLQTE